MLVVVEDVQDGLRVLKLHLSRDVGVNQHVGPGLRHTRELTGVRVEPNMHHVSEFGRVAVGCC